MDGSDAELAAAWRRHVGTSPAHESALGDLLVRHGDPTRHYHDSRHVLWVVRDVVASADRPGIGIADLDAVVAAAFFHDAVHDVERSDNERRSADLARSVLDGLGWDSSRCSRVASMILATEHRPAPDPADVDTAVLIAADLGVLASPPSDYSAYVRRVRLEYGHLDDHQWAAGRSEMIDGFLGRTAIFPRMLGLDDRERRARSNLMTEAESLRTPGRRIRRPS